MSLLFRSYFLQLIGDDEINVSDVLAVLNAVAVQSKTSGLEVSTSSRFTTTAEAAKEVLAQEKGSNLVIFLFHNISNDHLTLAAVSIFSIHKFITGQIDL